MTGTARVGVAAPRRGDDDEGAFVPWAPSVSLLPLVGAMMTFLGGFRARPDERVAAPRRGDDDSGPHRPVRAAQRVAAPRRGDDDLAAARGTAAADGAGCCPS